MESIIQNTEQNLELQPFVFYISLDGKLYDDTPITSYEVAIAMGYYALAIDNFYYSHNANSENVVKNTQSFYIQVHGLKIKEQELNKLISNHKREHRIKNPLDLKSYVTIKEQEYPENILKEVIHQLGKSLQTDLLATYKIESGVVSVI